MSRFRLDGNEINLEESECNLDLLTTEDQLKITFPKRMHHLSVTSSCCPARASDHFGGLFFIIFTYLCLQVTAFKQFISLAVELVLNRTFRSQQSSLSFLLA